MGRQSRVERKNYAGGYGKRRIKEESELRKYLEEQLIRKSKQTELKINTRKCTLTLKEEKKWKGYTC